MKTTIAIAYNQKYYPILPRVLSDVLTDIVLKEERHEPYEILVLTVSYSRKPKVKILQRIIENIVLSESGLSFAILKEAPRSETIIKKYPLCSLTAYKPRFDLLSFIKSFFEKTGVRIEVAQEEIVGDSFSKIFSKTLEILKKKIQKSDKVYLNISCGDKISSIIFLLVTWILFRKYRNIELMPIRSDANPEFSLKIPLIPFDIKHKKTLSKIIEALTQVEELNVSEIARLTQLSKSAISKVLPILEQYNFIQTEIKGREKVVKRGELFEIARAVLLD